jgi:Protein NO VEIN, C-terminal
MSKYESVDKPDKQLEELTRQRKDHVESCRKNNDKSHKIIAEQYSDPSHFIYEILSNADDAEATEIRFELTRQNLKIVHNGKKQFAYDDIEAITTIGNSTKANDINTIGTFGVGFKSVFAVTNTPKIYSQEYNCEIRDFIVPHKINPIQEECKDTTFIIPFNHETLDASKAYKQVSNKIKTLESESLLFLRNLTEIQWATEDESGHYIADPPQQEQNAKRVYILSQKKGMDGQEYLLFEKEINVEQHDLKVAIAYAVDDQNDDKQRLIKPIDNAKLSVFFPTNEGAGLKFLLHAPYKTTPNRETIPFDDEQNKILSNALAELAADSLVSVKQLGLLNVDFLNVLPIIDNEDHPLYSLIYKSIKEKLLSNEALLPTSDGQHTEASKALLADGKELVDLLRRDDTKLLFGKEYWLDTNITYDRTKELRNYLLKELNIKEIGPEDFAKAITEDFFSHKFDEWIIEFYAVISKSHALYRKKTDWQKAGILRSMPIIRLDDNTHVAPCDKMDEPQVYLATPQKSNFKTIKTIFVEDERSKDFLLELGLKEPDKVAEIKEHIAPKYVGATSNITEEVYINDLKQAMAIWRGATAEEKTEIQNILNKVNFVRARNEQDIICFKKPHEVYLPTDDLKQWFDKNDEDDVYFFEDNFLQKLEEIEIFLHNIGINSTLCIWGNNSYKDYDSMRSKHIRGLNGFNPTFMIEGLEFAIKQNNINLIRSLYLLKIALENTDRIKGIVEESSRQDFTPNGKHYQKKEMSSKAGNLLIVNQWLYDKNGCLIEKPHHEITIDDLHDDYDKGHDKIDKLIKVLGLKPDEIKAIEEKTGGKFFPKEQTEEYEELKREKREREKQETENERWVPDYQPEEPPITIDNRALDPINTNDLSGQNPKDNDRNSKGENRDNVKNKESGKKHSKEIGKWGESYAKRYLEQKHSQDGYQIIWLNQNGNTGKGYDFVIRDECDEEIAYYEVKSKTDEDPELIEVTGTQWEWARKLYDEEKGDKYIILAVLNTGTDKPKIKLYPNPIGLWKEGKIKAHPVNLEI